MKIIAIILTFLISGCSTIYNPATGRDEIILIGAKTEVAWGRSMADGFKNKLKISNNKALMNRLESIGKKVSGFSDRKELEYHFYVVEDKEINAFALPGGFIFVNSGLIESATDDELACVVAHELGHIAAKHSVKRLQLSIPISIIMAIASNKIDNAYLVKAMDITETTISLGFSRGDERLADKLAVKYAYNSGYNPDGMISFFKKLDNESKKQGKSSPFVYFSSHPPIEERINYSYKNIEELRIH